MSIVRESVINIYKKKVGEIREDLGRNVRFVMPSVDVKCPNCSYDINTKTSTGIYQPDDPYPVGIQGPNKLIGPQLFKSGFCPVCIGKGTIVKDNIFRDVKCLVEWLSAEEIKFLAESQKINAEIEIRSVEIKEYEYALSAEHFIVDGHTMYMIRQPTKEGLRDLIKFSFLASKDNDTRKVK